MQIKINNELVDFSLEKERNLEDILDGFQTWLSSEGYRISQYKLNGREILPGEDKEVGTTPVEQVNLLEITAITDQEFLVQRYHTLQQYLSLCGKALRSGNIPLWEDLRGEYLSVRTGIGTYLLDNSEGSRELLLLFDNLVEQNKIGNKPERTAEVLPFIDNLTTIAEERLREITLPLQELHKTMHLLLALKNHILEIPILLQTGKDREAFATILRFIELNQKIQRLISNVNQNQPGAIESVKVEETSLADFYQDFNQILKELLLAFENEDTVLAGDLFEYEIIPRMDRLGEFTSRLQEDTANE